MACNVFAGEAAKSTTSIRNSESEPEPNQLCQHNIHVGHRKMFTSFTKTAADTSCQSISAAWMKTWGSIVKSE